VGSCCQDIDKSIDRVLKNGIATNNSTQTHKEAFGFLNMVDGGGAEEFWVVHWSASLGITGRHEAKGASQPHYCITYFRFSTQERSINDDIS
jgi:hypothetical protein